MATAVERARQRCEELLKNAGSRTLDSKDLCNSLLVERDVEAATYEVMRELFGERDFPCPLKEML